MNSRRFQPPVTRVVIDNREVVAPSRRILHDYQNMGNHVVVHGWDPGKERGHSCPHLLPGGETANTMKRTRVSALVRCGAPRSSGVEDPGQLEPCSG